MPFDHANTLPRFHLMFLYTLMFFCISVYCLPAQAQATHNDGANLPDLTQPTTAQIDAVKHYIHLRYNRVKATVKKDREQAHAYMSDSAWQVYQREFHPEKALQAFTDCTDCDQFHIKITSIGPTHCAVIRLSVDAVGDMVCYTRIYFHSMPLSASASTRRAMAAAISWRPRGAVDLKPGDDIVRPRKENGTLIHHPGDIDGPLITVTSDRMLVPKTPLGECLGKAAQGRLCK